MSSQPSAYADSTAAQEQMAVGAQPTTERQLGLIGRTLRWLSQTFGSGSEDATNIEKIVNQTERVSMRLFLISMTVLVALLVVAVARNSWNFAIWGMTGALASAMVGGALGVLFGLPTVNAKKEVIAATQPPATPPQAQPPANQPDAAAAPQGTEKDVAPPAGEQAKPAAVLTKLEDLDIGYRDSTSLEQIADWLTKIIIGLTLTQYESWEGRFQQLSANLTESMLGAPTNSPLCGRLINGLNKQELVDALKLEHCSASAIPGGSIIALFATAGFLIAYLWMRRYFILEMVIGGKQAREMLAAKRDEIRNEAKLTKQKYEAERSKAELESLRNAALVLEAELDRQRQVARAKLAEQEKAIEAASQVSLAEESRGRTASTDPQRDRIIEKGLERFSAESEARAALQQVQNRLATETLDRDDPWRGKFGSASANGVRIEAKVSPLVDNPQFFKVDLRVQAESEPRAAELLGSKVLYFLHPTFGAEPRVSAFGADGIAPLELFAYGAFTVGALIEDGTLLELNLATVAGAPTLFLTQ